MRRSLSVQAREDGVPNESVVPKGSIAFKRKGAVARISLVLAAAPLSLGLCRLQRRLYLPEMPRRTVCSSSTTSTISTRAEALLFFFFCGGEARRALLAREFVDAGDEFFRDHGISFLSGRFL